MSAAQITQITGTVGKWKLTVNGREVACASARSMGASGGVYWFNITQSEMTKEAAEIMFKEYFAGDGRCRFATVEAGECTNFESNYFGWLCAHCGRYSARNLGGKVLPQKNAETAQEAK